MIFRPFANLTPRFRGLSPLQQNTHIHICRCHSDTKTKNLAWVLGRLPYNCIYIYIYNCIYNNVWIRGVEQRYGTEVWNGSFKEVWNGGMERVWSRSLFRTSYFDLLPF